MGDQPCDHETGRAADVTDVLQMSLTDVGVLAVLDGASAACLPLGLDQLEIACALNRGEVVEVLDRLRCAGLVDGHPDAGVGTSQTDIVITCSGRSALDRCRGVLRRLQEFADRRLTGGAAAPGSAVASEQGPAHP